MKKLFSLITMAMLVMSILPVVFATDVGIGITPDIATEDFEPLVWGCDSRLVTDDNTEPGRDTTVLGCSGATLNVSGEDSETAAEKACDAVGGTYDSGANGLPSSDTCTNVPYDNKEDCEENSGSWSLVGEVLTERKQNYAFEGEQIAWTVLVMDKNGINKIEDVFATIGATQGAGNDIEVNCVPTAYLAKGTTIDTTCNARIGEEILETVPEANMMATYTCTFTVETVESMDGEYWVTVEATDLDGLSGTMAENEYWYFNPTIGISIDGDLDFSDVRPGTASYSTTLLIGNDADSGSGVMMDMFISGSDFYDSSSSGAMCPTTNQLSLDAFSYYATSGAYSSQDDLRADADPQGENYVPIEYGIGFNNPNPFYDTNEIIQTTTGDYSDGNVLSPGSEMAITFRLMLPEPCNGDFDEGSIYFWGEAI